MYMCPWILANIYSTMRGNAAQLVGTCAFMLFFSLRFEDLNTIYKKMGPVRGSVLHVIIYSLSRKDNL